MKIIANKTNYDKGRGAKCKSGIELSSYWKPAKTPDKILVNQIRFTDFLDLSIDDSVPIFIH